MKRFAYFLSLILAVSMILTACGAESPTPVSVVPTNTSVPPEPTATTAPQPITFTGGLAGDIVTLDPQKAVTSADDIVNTLVWEGLVAMSADGEWQGVLAETWDTSTDGLIWTFHLRHGVKFHNGREMTSDDVVYSFNRIMDPANGATMNSIYVNKITSVEAVDPYTVKIAINGGSGTFLSELGLVVRTAIIAKECVDSSGNITQPIGTGPFKFDSWEPGVKWVGQKNPDYWGQVAKIDTVTFVPFSNDITRLTALQTGEIDWMTSIPFDQVQQMQASQDPNIVLHLTYPSDTLRINFNNTKPPFNNPLLRQVVAYAINKEEFNQAMFFGYGHVHNQPFTPDSFLYLNVPDIYGHGDLDKARSLLAEAGYQNGFEIDVIHPQGIYPGFWEVISSQLSPLNIKLNVEMMDIPQFVDRAINSKYDMFADEQSSIFHWDRTFGYFEKSSSSNWLVGGYDNETVTTLLATGRNMTDLIQAKGVYTAILQKIQDDAGAIFVLALPDVQAWRSWLKEFEPNPMNKLLVYPGGGLNYATIEK